MINALVISSEEGSKTENYTEKPLIVSQEKCLVTPQLSIDISKREHGVVIKIKKNFRKQD